MPRTTSSTKRCKPYVKANHESSYDLERNARERLTKFFASHTSTQTLPESLPSHPSLCLTLNQVVYTTYPDIRLFRVRCITEKFLYLESCSEDYVPGYVYGTDRFTVGVPKGEFFKIAIKSHKSR